MPQDPVGGGGSTYRVPSGFVWDETTWTDKQWTHSPSGKGAIVGAYQGGHWGSWLFEVDDVDQASKTVSFGKGGFQEARGSKSGGEHDLACSGLGARNAPRVARRCAMIPCC